MVKYHIGKNGPAPCGANPDKPGGRECRYKEGIHGSEEEVQKAYEKQMEDQGSFAPVISKQEKSSEGNNSLETTKTVLSDKKYYSIEKYYQKDDDEISDVIQDQEIAMQLALTDISPLAYMPVKREDEDFFSSGFSSVKRIELEDGTVGYFKSFVDNAENENTSKTIRDYEETAISSTINEVNAYRMAKAMGPEYEELIPETVIREYDGKLGSFQKGVKGGLLGSLMFHDKKATKRAALIDSVINSQDRHFNNILENNDGENRKFYLIDNSFSFTKETLQEGNQTIACDLHRDKKITEEEKRALLKAREASERWEREGTLSPRRGRALRERIDILTSEEKIVVFFN